MLKVEKDKEVKMVIRNGKEFRMTKRRVKTKLGTLTVFKGPRNVQFIKVKGRFFQLNPRNRRR